MNKSVVELRTVLFFREFAIPSTNASVLPHIQLVVVAEVGSFGIDGGTVGGPLDVVTLENDLPYCDILCAAVPRPKTIRRQTAFMTSLEISLVIRQGIVLLDA